MTKSAIIIGATSGIGHALAKVLAHHGYTLGIAGRRTERLEQLKTELPTRTFAAYIDISRPDDAIRQLSALIAEMGKVDLIVISSGTGHINPELDWQPEKETIDINVAGFAAMANVAMHHFLANGSGHLVGISSIAALRGNQEAPSYNASKAFMSNYLEGMRRKAFKSGAAITVTDIQPGFVDTPMAQGEGLFWVAPAEKAAKQIYAAIARKRTHAYITRRWRLIAWVMKLLPNFIYDRI